MSSKKPHALEAVHVGQDPRVDIIAVHGLGADADWSWVWKDKETPERQVRWLQDKEMLPAQVPNSRILLYNYDSKWHQDAPKTRLTLCGEDLIRSINVFRRNDKTADRPIVFVGHSLGGNVIQHALLFSNSDDESKNIIMLTAGIVFLGSPLRGTKLQILPKLLTLLLYPTGAHDGIINDLSHENPTLRDKLHDFCRMCNTFSIHFTCFFEEYESDIGKSVLRGVIKGMVVEEQSACIDGAPRRSLQADHFGMNKYCGPQDRSFTSVSVDLSKFCDEAPVVVQRRLQPNPIITDRDLILKSRPDAKDCLQALFITDPFEDIQVMKRKKGKRAKGTCDWILGTEPLTAWLGDSPESMSPPKDVFWLYGNPGTGKSTMSMFLAEKLSEVFSKTHNKTLAYFFCDSSYDTRRTATSIIRGLLLQLVQQHPHLIDHILPKYTERGARAFESFDSLWGMLLKVCADTVGGRKYCIIDALDECTEDDKMTLLKQIKEIFGRDRSGGGLNVSFLITSRPYNEISEHLEEFPRQDLGEFEMCKRDINILIDEKVSQLSKRKKYTERLATDVTNLLREKASGIFLWVGLACQELEKVGSRGAIKKLQEIPEDLHKLYSKLLDAAREQDDDPELVDQLLGFVMVAIRPLTTWELASACGLYQDEGEEERIQFTAEAIAACRLMIVVQDNKVLLLHQSVKDFLVRGTGINKSPFDELQIHSKLASRCVDCLIAKFSPPYQAGQAKKDDGLVSYSREFWPEHAHMAKEMFMIEDRQSQFFTIDSKTRDRWWRDYRTFHTIPIFKPRHQSIFHVAARWGVPQLVDYALSSRQSRTGAPEDRTVYRTYIDTAYRDTWGRTPLRECANSGSIEVLKTMLRRSDTDNDTEEGVLVEAARNEQSGVEMMKFLLSPRGNRTKITKKIIEAAAENDESGAEVIQVLLKSYQGVHLTLTEEIIEKAVKNKKSGDKVMRTLLDGIGGQVTITERIAGLLKENEECGVEIIMLLLKWKKGKIEIDDGGIHKLLRGFKSEVISVLLSEKGDQITSTFSGDIFEIAAFNEDRTEIMRLLLNWEGGEMRIPEWIIGELIQFSTMETIMLLLNRKGDQVTITEDIFQLAAGNELDGDKVVQVLLNQRRGQFIITEDIIRAAAHNKGTGAEIMRILLSSEEGAQLNITKDIMKEAAKNREPGARVIEVLINQYGDHLTITTDILEAAAENEEAGARVIEILLNQYGDRLTITQDIIRAAASNWKQGARLVAILINQYRDRLTITQDIIRAAASNWKQGARLVAILINQYRDRLTITEDILKIAARNEEQGASVVEILINQYGDRLTITEDILKTAASNWKQGARVVEILINQYGDRLTITEDILKRAARNEKQVARVLEILINQYGDRLTITEYILKRAASNWNQGARVLEILINHYGDRLTITEDILKTALRNEKQVARVLEILINQYGDRLTITEDILKRAASNWNQGARVVEILINQYRDRLTITEDILKTAARNQEQGARVLEILINQYGDRLTITQDIIMAAAKNRQEGFQLIKLFLDYYKDSLFITEDTIITILSKQWQLYDDRVVDILILRKGDKVRITQSIIFAALKNTSLRVFKGLLHLAEREARGTKALLDRSEDKIKITEDVVKGVTWFADRRLKLQLLLDWMGDRAEITDDMIAAVSPNAMYGDEIREILLERKEELEYYQ